MLWIVSLSKAYLIQGKILLALFDLGFYLKNRICCALSYFLLSNQEISSSSFSSPVTFFFHHRSLSFFKLGNIKQFIFITGHFLFSSPVTFFFQIRKYQVVHFHHRSLSFFITGHFLFSSPITFFFQIRKYQVASSFSSPVTFFITGHFPFSNQEISSSSFSSPVTFFFHHRSLSFFKLGNIKQLVHFHHRSLSFFINGHFLFSSPVTFFFKLGNIKQFIFITGHFLFSSPVTFFFQIRKYQVASSFSSPVIFKISFSFLKDYGKVDGIRRIVMSGGLSLWQNKLLFLDALAHCSLGAIVVPLDRFILVDVDDIFVAKPGIRIKEPDVTVR